MKFVTYEYNKKQIPGILSENKVFALSEFGFNQNTLEGFIIESDGNEVEVIKNGLSKAKGIKLEDVKLLAPIPAPRQEILIMQNNYPGQPANEKPELPTYYYKKASEAYTDGAVIPRYNGYLKELDVQVELCAVTRNDVYKCDFKDAHSQIFGYMLMNNVIAHDITVKHRRPYISTGLNGFLQVSPFIVSADEFEENHSFVIESYVNGKLLQKGNTSDMLFTPEYAIWDISRASVLYGASIISTGTPSGNLRDKNMPFLETGDVVCCSCTELGSFRNQIA